ncbi:MHO_1590 family protein [Mycoplasma sp. Mirounga ES2805-ORL]|uniref:MHO_1590 family protein n=1 Tax=Mycoplasma sp. Mirounga ES2805-ORL TaxID=754514 RepID=UPI00197BDE1D|nr:hypothetical protein [Mycoplasma sp. Mirounga ES2805-ORL]QSF13526.1 hypothetical protein JXZ90_02515 [Mycoplasma sp. Mirounga ES2805-ORL]
MRRKYKKIIWPVTSIALVAAIATPIAVVSAKKLNNSVELDPIKVEDNDKDVIFPKLNNEDFNKYIRIKGYKYFLDKKIILDSINYVINKINFNSGNLEFDYQIISKTKIIIFFKWINGELNKKISYTFEIEDKTNILDNDFID